MMVQHLHACVWPHLITPFFLRERHSDPQTQRKESQGKVMWEIDSDSQTQHEDGDSGMRKRVEKKAPPTKWRVELAVDVDNLSLSVLDNPSNTTSYGLCAEVSWYL